MTQEALKRIAEKLRRAGASLPAPELTGTIEGSVVTGLCIALALVETEIEALAQPEQEPVCDKDPQGCWNVRCQLGKKCKNTPPQRTEQNFCSRCGKRTNDIHTCTPPKENT
jgi:hypothetical protein